MKSSIKLNMIITFIIVLFISEIGFIALSNLYLDDIVISANRILIQRVYKQYEPYFKLEEIDINKLHEISKDYDMGIAVYENNIITACSSYLCTGQDNDLPTLITNYIPYVKENEPLFLPMSLVTIKFNRMVYIVNLGDGKYVIIDKGIDSLQQINQILKGFIQITGVLIFILGSIIIYIISNRITKPIIRISSYAKDIANLNFQNKLNITNKDEIGHLASNMNLISERLNEALKELNETNQNLKNDLEKEKELDRKRVKFFSTVSHEFKTPITIIQGYAEGLKHNIAKSKEDIDEYCDIIIEESKKMGNFVNELLNLSLYESGNFVLNKTDFDLVELINKTANKFNDLILNKQINLSIDGPTSSIINADKYRIEQVITNFLSNAIKHVDVNGLIKITIIDKKESVEMFFFNNGEKIDETEIKNIWSLFYKLESKKNHMGTGIGLAIVKSIVELHNGKYGVKNKNDGVEFFVEIPKI